MDLQTIALMSGGAASMMIIGLLMMILRKLSTAGLGGHHHIEKFDEKLLEACEPSNNPFENIDSFVIRLGDGFGRIYVVENRLTKQHFLFSKDFSIAEWQK